MGDSGFEFKRFVVKQDRCAMKVGTDGVLLGAWVGVEGATSVLDIGAGTGLVSLMIAQRTGAVIHAVEIDEAAAVQASENFKASPWGERMRVYNEPIQEFAVNKKRAFDLIVSNPPYFESGIESPREKRAIARHNGSLSLAELLSVSNLMLTENGKMGLVLPVELRSSLVTCLSKYNMWIDKEVKVHPKPDMKASRLLFALSKHNKSFREKSDIVIETGIRHNYTKEYVDLVKRYLKVL